MQATKVGRDTTLAQIIRLVEEAQGSKAPIAKLADQVSAIFVPVVMGLALLSGLAWYFLGQESWIFFTKYYHRRLGHRLPLCSGLSNADCHHGWYWKRCRKWPSVQVWSSY